MHGAAAARPYETDGAPVYAGGPPGPRAPSGVSNGRLALVMLMVAETMLFTTLVGGYVVLRGAGGQWPPPGQPRLPLGITWVNTFVLMASAWTMARARRSQARRDARALKLSLIETALLGSTFLAVQGTEWTKLVSWGLTLSASVYGATFYALIGLHGAHVLAAVIWLLVVVARLAGDRFSMARGLSVELCAMYWFYVCGLWAVLFPLVYLF